MTRRKRRPRFAFVLFHQTIWTCDAVNAAEAIQKAHAVIPAQYHGQLAIIDRRGTPQPFGVVRVEGAE